MKIVPSLNEWGLEITSPYHAYTKGNERTYRTKGHMLSAVTLLEKQYLNAKPFAYKMYHWESGEWMPLNDTSKS